MRDFRSQDSACTVPVLPLNCQAKALRPNKNVNQIEPACLPGSGRKRGGEQRLARLLSAEKWKVFLLTATAKPVVCLPGTVYSARLHKCAPCLPGRAGRRLSFSPEEVGEDSARLAAVHAQPRSFRLSHCSLKLLGLFGMACHTCRPKKGT